MAATDHVGSVLDRLEMMCDEFMDKSRKMARDDTAILHEQLERAQKRLRGGEGTWAGVTVSSRPALAPKDMNQPMTGAVPAKKAPAHDPAPADDNDEDDDANELSTDAMSFRDLQSELKSRGLKAAGKKNELKERLEQAIADEKANMESVASSHELTEDLAAEVAEPAPAPPAPVKPLEPEPAASEPVDVDLDVVVGDAAGGWSAAAAEEPARVPDSSMTRVAEMRAKFEAAPAAAAPEPKQAPATVVKPTLTPTPAAAVVEAAAPLPPARPVVAKSAAPPPAVRDAPVPNATDQPGLLGSVFSFAGSLLSGNGAETQRGGTPAAQTVPAPASSKPAPALPPRDTQTARALAAEDESQALSPRDTQSKTTGVQRHNLEEFRARQLKEAEERKAQQLLRDKERAERVIAEKKRKETEEAAKRDLAIKRREEAERRRKEAREEAERRRVDALAAAAPPPAPAVALTPAPAPMPPPALEAKRLTPAQPAVPSHAARTKEPKTHKAPSIIDTYEISDREESSDDDDDDDNKKSHKHVPGWAAGSSLREALKGQTGANPSHFFPMSASATCELKDIFNSTKPFKKRTSSQNWAQDLSTFQERQKYRKEMGYSPPEKF